ncbi:class I SAM-dependent methyltransferase [Methanospirillum sp.]
MDNQVIEINDKEIDVEEIMKTIRENIRRRKEAGLLPNDPEIGPSSLCSAPIVHSSNNIDLSYITGNYDIQNNSYIISSHRPYIGKYLVKGRSLVHGEISRYIDPVIRKQTEFNRCTASALDTMNNRIYEFDRVKNRLDELDEIKNILIEINTVKNRLDELDEIKNILIEINTVKNRLDEVESNYLSEGADIEKKAWLAQTLERRISNPKTLESEKISNSGPKDLGINYFVFEDRFRGTRVLIKERQKAFLQYFEGCRNVLDIGSGRGEFLELMKEQGIGARGVDMDETMVDYCRMRGLEVELIDAIAYLEGLEDGSLDGIFIDQVVEHLDPGYLIRLLQFCHQKMKYGFYLVAETVNPLSFYSFANFYIDLTHIRPVHPETLRFLFDNAGFRELEVNFCSQVSDELRMKKLEFSDNLDQNMIELITKNNQNIDLVNNILFGAQDYSVIGKK